MKSSNLNSCKTVLLVATFLTFLNASSGYGQDAVPAEILSRTQLIRVGTQVGTAFSIDYHGKLYIITARHVVSELTGDKATIQVRKADNWLNIQTKRTLFPSSNQVDIAIFETDEKLEKPYEIQPAGGSSGPTMGQQVWFLGYPYGIGSKFKNGEAPFIKRGTMSAIDASNPNAVLVYIDGFNNPGFSGGPIIYWDFSDHKYRILGVVKGYRFDAAKVLVKGEPVDTQLLVNSGILIGYSIEHALKAIESNSDN